MMNEWKMDYRTAMNEWKMDYRTANIQNGAVHEIGEHNFMQHQLATRNQNGCSSLGCKYWSLIQTRTRGISIHLLM